MCGAAWLPTTPPAQVANENTYRRNIGRSDGQGSGTHPQNGNRSTSASYWNQIGGGAFPLAIATVATRGPAPKKPPAWAQTLCNWMSLQVNSEKDANPSGPLVDGQTLGPPEVRSNTSAKRARLGLHRCSLESAPRSARKPVLEVPTRSARSAWDPRYSPPKSEPDKRDASVDNPLMGDSSAERTSRPPRLLAAGISALVAWAS